MNLEAFLAAAQAAHDAVEADAYGNKLTIREEALADGRKVSVELTGKRDRFTRTTKTSIRFKLDGKVIARAALAATVSGRAANWSESINPELRSEFEAQAPALAADMKSYLTRLWTMMVERHPAGVPKHKGDRGDQLRMQSLRTVVKDVPGTPSHQWQDTKVVLDEKALDRYCEKYGMEAAVQWFYKTNEKLGELTEAELIEDAGGYVVVLGKRAGKAIRFAQQRIINTSVNGKPYHQYPSRIYVDSKFVPDAAYQKLMLLADAAT